MTGGHVSAMRSLPAWLLAITKCQGCALVDEGLKRSSASIWLTCSGLSRRLGSKALVV
jgi:hypothetical protein